MPEPEVSEDEAKVWVRTGLAPDDKTFVVTVEITDDRAVVLSQGGAMRWAMGVLMAVAFAEYEEVVYKQLSALVGELSALQVIRDLRDDRPALDHKMTRPLAFEPGLSSTREVGFLTLVLDGKPIGQWDLGPAREHALGVMEAVIAADLDALYLRELVGVIGLDRDRSLAAVADLQRFRP